MLHMHKYVYSCNHSLECLRFNSWAITHLEQGGEIAQEWAYNYEERTYISFTPS